MPLFGKKKVSEQHANGGDSPISNCDTAQLNNTVNPPSPNGGKPKNGSLPSVTPPPPESPRQEMPVQKPRWVFHCQQAHGSPTGLISGFTNIRELYRKIADCYDFPVSDILFCTLNTHKVDMTKLLGGQIGLEDFIFVHRKGQAKEVEITKTDDALGLTITDNGAGYAFIKRIKESSVVDRFGFIQVGDHIAKINNKSMVECRHFEVAKTLKEIPKGETFTMRLIEPMKAGFSHIGPRSGPGGGGKKNTTYGSGKETLRLRAKGPATIEEAPCDVVQAAVEKINGLLETFMGINDSELATQIWELGREKPNPHDFVQAIDNSDLEAFGFTDEFVYDLWGCINDAKVGRLKKENAQVAF